MFSDSKYRSKVSTKSTTGLPASDPNSPDCRYTFRVQFGSDRSGLIPARELSRRRIVLLFLRLASQGNLDTGTAPAAEEDLQGLIDDGKRKILMDFSTLDYISSGGLRVLLSTSKKLRSSGGEIRLHSLNETVAEIFDMSGFSTIL